MDGRCPTPRVRPLASITSLTHQLRECSATRVAVISSQQGNKELPPIGADVGDTLIFRWSPGEHAVVELPDEAKYYTCARLAMASRAGTQDTPFRWVVPRPGTFFFACPVDSHCEQGLKVRVVANAP